MTQNTTPVFEAGNYKIAYVEVFGDDGNMSDCFFEVSSPDGIRLDTFPTLEAAQEYAANI